MIEKAEFEPLPNGEILTHILNWSPYECSTTAVPRSQDAAIIMWEGSPSTNSQASHGGARSGVDLSAGTARDARTAANYVSHDTGRARVTGVIPTAVEKRAKLNEQEERVNAKLVDLSKREIAVGDKEARAAAAKTSVATEVQPLHEMILALASLATNPSGVTPPGLEGVTVMSAGRNHLQARAPSIALSLVSGDVVGGEITTAAPVETQPQGRGSERVLRLFRSASPAFGTERYPIFDSAPTTGAVLEGAQLTQVDALYRNPALEVAPASDAGQKRPSACSS